MCGSVLEFQEPCREHGVARIATAVATTCMTRTGLRITSSEQLRMHEMAFALEKFGLPLESP